ncbi:nuclear pore complex protein Nup153 isoform X2 [Megalops cyprinoides]|uniref:nuclear pore complex protein Nup153 isoform X2 n=1 Tax=Megalops cyprinoides TaxID=118141 RepID=UPI00186558BB|nr:nuclear pore complex protein Nup153 isoform X2 [Megalops cyprinoides]
MASAGGGKIRSRRYHIASKPYAKGKQGLISRVTDTVKSIVPAWLQSYFRNGEPAQAEGPGEENSQPPLPADGEDPSPLPDGRDSPKASTSNAEPSTSRAALNLHDVLARPPLNRTHLHLPSLDTSPALRGGTSTLFSQPSTSSAPYTAGGPSGFSLVKEIKDSSSLHEDDNISTTSGFSSRASDKDVTTSKNVPFMWSPENDRSHTGPQPAGSSLKKPAFNLSVFGTSSASPSNSLMLNSSKLGDSPFYPGKTTYGGSAAVRSSARVRADTPYQAPVRRQIKAKGAGSQPCGVTSLTARRILQSLERMSSPLADAKRIPSPCSLALPTALNRSDIDVTHLQSKRKKMDSQLPPVQKLVTPATPQMAGNRSMSFRPCLTPCSSQSLTQDRQNSKDRSAKQSTQMAEAPVLPPQSTSSLYPLSSTPAANGMDSRGSGGKMKRERSIRASTKPAPEDEVVEAPDLPPISLPISTFSLPTFNFSSPPQATAATSSPAASSTPITNKAPPAASSPPCVPFTFSSPIVKATEPSVLPLSPSSGFTFSAPVAKAGLSDLGGKATSLVTPVKSSAASASPAKKSEEFEGPFQPAKTLKQGSVLDILKGPGFSSSSTGSASLPDKVVPSSQGSSSDPGSAPSAGFGDKFKPVAGSWSCETCLLSNSPSLTKCAACNAEQPSAGSAPSESDSKPTPAPSAQAGAPPVGLGTLFAPAAGSWECDTCLVQNKPDVVKCVACETRKTGTGVKPALTAPAFGETQAAAASSSSSGGGTTTNTPSSGLFGFGDKFKKPEGTWECDTCMLENKPQDSKCVSCQSTKPGASAPSAAPSSTEAAPAPAGGTLLGFGDKFKKAEGAWDCDVCCVQNGADALKCVACQSDKPGAKVEPKGFGSSTTSTGSASASTFTFGIQSSSSTDLTPSSSEGFKFGDQGGFKFGNTSVGGFGGGFKFNTSFAAGEENEKKSESSSGGFKFGSGGGIVFGSGSSSESTDKSLSKPTEAAATAAPPKPDEATTTAPTLGGSGFVFSAPKDKPETETAPASFTPATTAATPFSFGKPLETKPPASQPQGGFTFGKSLEKEPAESTPALPSVAPAPAPAPTPSFSFGKPEEKQETAPAPSTFLFSGAKEGANPAPASGFSFSKPDPPKEDPKPVFSFGKPPEKTDAAETPKPTFSFGGTATDATAAKPAFGFMAGSTSSSSSSAPAPSLFGASSSGGSAPAPAPAPNSTFVFGQGASSEATPTKTFVFGQQQDSKPQPAAPQNTAAAPSTAQPFLFGTGTNASVPSFNFSAAAPSTASSTASASSAAPFMFGSASASSAAPVFGAGAASGFGQSSSQPSAPAFGSGAPSLFSTPASQPPAFGVQPGAGFGQQANATPSFASAAASSSSTPGGGFHFGDTSAFGASSSGTGVFTFGAAAGASAAPSPTPAGQAQPTAPGGGFNFCQPPAFNIGSTKSSFTASTPGQHSITGRKIKTAVRRRK